MRIVMLEREVAEAEVEDRRHRGIQGHGGQRTRLAGELKLGLIEVIGIEVEVPEGVNEIAGFQSANLRHDQCQQS